jgi:hypothetical protein
MGHKMARLHAEFVAVGSILASLAGILPAIATLLAIVWYGVMLYDRFWRKK